MEDRFYSLWDKEKNIRTYVWTYDGLNKRNIHLPTITTAHTYLGTVHIIIFSIIIRPFKKIRYWYRTVRRSTVEEISCSMTSTGNSDKGFIQMVQSYCTVRYGTVRTIPNMSREDRIKKLICDTNARTYARLIHWFDFSQALFYKPSVR